MFLSNRFELKDQRKQIMFQKGTQLSEKFITVYGTPLSLHLHQNISCLYRCCPKSWRFCIYSFTEPIPHRFQQVLDRVDDRVGQSKAQNDGLVIAEIFKTLRPPHSERPALLVPCHWSILQHLGYQVRPSLLSARPFSPVAVSREGQGQIFQGQQGVGWFSTALRVQQAWFL